MARYSRKDYQLTASVIKGRRDIHINANGYDALNHEATLDALAESFAREYMRDNPNFDAERFLDACGVDNAAECAGIVKEMV